MAQIPSAETLTIIAGIGGWAGTWHAASIYFEDGPIMIDRAAKMLILPFAWGAGSILAYVCGISAINTSGVIFGAMFHPVPFVLNIVLMSMTVSVLSAYVYIRNAFKSSAERVADEIALEAAIQAAAAAHESEDEDGEEADGEETEDEEAEEQSTTSSSESEDESEETIPAEMVLPASTETTPPPSVAPDTAPAEDEVAPAAIPVTPAPEPETA